MAKRKPLPAPPYPADTSARGFTFGLSHQHIEPSDTWTLANADLKPWLLMLWYRSWQQIPSGAFPDDDRLIAARIGMSLSRFKANRSILMRGWWRASDGRLYHPFISAMVLERIEWRNKEADRKKAWRMSHGTDTGRTRDSTVRDDTGAGAGAGAEELPNPHPPTAEPNPGNRAPATEKRGAGNARKGKRQNPVPRADDVDALARYGADLGIRANPGEDAMAYRGRIFAALRESGEIPRDPTH